jgi:hypothetical protein
MCLEIEDPRIMNGFSCLVIREYVTTRIRIKNDRWQSYAAATAALYAKEPLRVVSGPDCTGLEWFCALSA